jgi:hypothetical protein
MGQENNRRNVIMRNYECLRGGHGYRDIYTELQNIEERGKRMKKAKKPLFSSLSKSSGKERKEAGAVLTA